MRYAFSMDPSLATEIARQGLLGVLLIVAGTVAWLKDRELRAERIARIEDAQNYTELALKLQAQVIDAVNKLSNILNEMKKLMGRPTRTSLSEVNDE